MPRNRAGSLTDAVYLDIVAAILQANAYPAGAKELAEFAKGGELAKHVTRIGAGPKGATIKGPDAETLDAWAAVK